MKKRIIKTSILSVFACVLWSCGTDDTGITDTVAPAEIRNLTVKSASNGSITFGYDLPEDEDVYYVKLHYAIGAKVIERKASFLNDSIVVEGLPDTDTRTYEFVAGDRYGNESKAVQISVACDTPPHLLAFNSAITKPDYGGGKITWSNSSKSWVYLNVVYNDKNDISVMQTFKSKAPADSVSFGEMWAGEKSFSYYFSDRFGNNTQKKEATVKALPAQLIPKDKMKLIYLDGDLRQWTSITDLFDNDINDRVMNPNNSITDFYIPNYITVDLGREAQVTKMVLNAHPTQTYNHYAADLLKEFEVYGTTENLTTGQDPNSVSWVLMIPQVAWVPQFPALTSGENMTKGFTAVSTYLEKVRFLRVKLISRYVMTGGPNSNWYGRYCIGGEWSFFGSF